MNSKKKRMIVEAHTSGSRDTSRQLWALIQLELWLRTFVDAGARGPVALDIVEAA